MKASLLWIWMVFPALLAADQWTKYWVQIHLQPVFTISVIPGFFNLTYVRNTGVAFGLMGGNNLLLTVMAVVLILCALYLSRSLNWHSREVNFLAAILLVGAVGNLIDRLHYGYVVDFLDFNLGFMRWPCFNVADSCITCAVGWIIGRSLFMPTSGKSVAGK